MPELKEEKAPPKPKCADCGREKAKEDLQACKGCGKKLCDRCIELHDDVPKRCKA